MTHIGPIRVSSGKRYFPFFFWMRARKHIISAVAVSHLVTTREASVRYRMGQNQVHPRPYRALRHPPGLTDLLSSLTSGPC